jgi:RHS repeat-associated protein
VDGNQSAPSPVTASSYNSGDQTPSLSPSGQGSTAATYGGNGQAGRLSFGTTTYTNGLQGLLSATTSGASTYYERDPSGTLISKRGPGGEFYYVTDGLGSTVALVDTTGTVQATYSYDPYTNATTVGGPNPAIANANPYRYAGGYFDTTTGLYHFGQRYYNPTTGRWTQQDSLNTPPPQPHQRQPLRLHRRQPHQRH